MYKILNKEENFHIWHCYNTFSSGCGEMIAFIDNGLIDYDVNLFVKYWDELRERADNFYFGVKKASGFEKDIKWDINYTERLYKIEEVEDTYDTNTFLFNTMNLRESFRERISEILKNF